MKNINKVIFIGKEKDAIQKVITGEMTLREAAEILNCSHEQVRLVMGKILLQGYLEGWIKIDFSKI